MENTREIKMVVLDRYAHILQQLGHKVEIHNVSDVEMKSVRLKAEQFIFD